MSFKAFLKPTPIKIFLFILLMIVTSIPANIMFSWGTWVDIGKNYGFPFNFYGYGGGPALRPEHAPLEYWHLERLIINAAIWYLVSCMLWLVYHKLKK